MVSEQHQHIPFSLLDVLSGSASPLPPEQGWFRHSYLRLSPMLGPPRRSASAITAAHWVLLGLRTHAGLATCLGHPAFPAEMRFDVLKASRSSFILLVERVCQRRWLKSHLTFTTLGAEPNVCSHLPLGSKQKPAGLGFRQSSFHHTRLALVTRRVGDSLLRNRPRMLWSPSSFEGRGKRGMHGMFHQFQQHLLHSFSADDAAHGKHLQYPQTGRTSCNTTAVHT